MYILFLTNTYSGGYHFRKELVESLIQHGHDVTYAAPVRSGVTIGKGLPFHVVDMPFNRRGLNPLKDLWLTIRYVRLLKKLKPDVVLSFTIKPNVYGGFACRLCHVPQIANVTGLGVAVERKGWLQKLTIWLYRIGLSKARTVFFQNRYNIDFCGEHRMVKTRKVLLPGSGVNLQRFSLQEYPVEQPLRFLFLGRMMKEKGINEYVEAARRIRKRYPDTEFHIVGTCEKDCSVRIESLKDDGIEWHGWQADVRPFINRCHCLVHPSYYPEGMSNVLLESCASGRPVITTDMPGCREIVDDGINGFVINSRDVDDLVEKIECFITLPHNQKCEMGLAARRKVEQVFDRQIVVNAYLEEIDSL